MERRNLTIRRFGALSFGLGYFEDGEWVDHVSPSRVERNAGERPEGVPSTPAAVDLVHDWYGCCSDPAVVDPSILGWDIAIRAERAEAES